MERRQQTNADNTGQLTTIFPAPTTCQPLPQYSENPGYALAQDASNGQWAIASAAPGCDPGDGQQTFSPGVCPHGYTPYTAGNLPPQTTQVACCLTGTLIPAGGSASCEYIITDTNSPLMLATEGSTYTLLSSGTLLKGALWVQWQSSDLNDFSPASAPLSMQNGRAFTEGGFSIDTGTSPAPTATPTNTLLSTSITTTTTSGTATSTGQSDGGGLSTGAEAGIGVGVGIVGLALILGVGYLVWRKRRRSDSGRTPTFDQGVATASPHPTNYYTPQDPAHTTGHYAPQDPKDGQQEGNQTWQPMSEAMSHQHPVELDANHRTYELYQ